MRARTRLLPATFALVASGCSCASAHEIDASLGDAAGLDAASSPDAVPDVGDDVFVVLVDTGVCSPSAALCNTDADCVAWGDATAPPGTYVSSMCTGLHCTRGVAQCRTHDGLTLCQCSDTVACGAGQICVSDTPGGPTRCAEACLGR